MFMDFYAAYPGCFKAADRAEEFGGGWGNRTPVCSLRTNYSPSELSPHRGQYRNTGRGEDSKHTAPKDLRMLVQDLKIIAVAPPW